MKNVLSPISDTKIMEMLDKKAAMKEVSPSVTAICDNVHGHVHRKQVREIEIRQSTCRSTLKAHAIYVPLPLDTHLARIVSQRVNFSVL